MDTPLEAVVRERFGALAGQPCWQVRRGYGSFLTLEFGVPRLCIREPRPPRPDRTEAFNRLHARRSVTVRGAWHLWIYGCSWRVFQGEEEVGKSTSHRQMDRGAAALDGQILTGMETDLAAGMWNFRFDLGGSLATQRYPRRSRYYRDDLDQWLLYEPDGKVLVVRADGSYSHHSGSLPPHEVRWKAAASGAWTVELSGGDE